MKDRCNYAKPLWSLALLLTTFGPWAAPLFGQDLQIMVNGPWSYATDPAQPDRIFLVAPKSNHHKTYIFVGTDADQLAEQTELPQPGLYTLDFDRGGTPINNPTDGEGAAIYSATVDRSRVSDVLKGKAPTNPPAPQPYVISLPRPDSYTTFVDPNGNYEGFSESKVYTSSQAHNSPKSVPPQLYTTWMVLHYGVKGFPNTATATGPNGSTTYTTTKSLPGISIVSGDPRKNPHDNKCDYVSLESLNDQTALWNLSTRYAHFPLQTLIPRGKQIHYHYDYSCSDTAPDMADQWHGEAGGSADCHTSQLSINKAGPQPPSQ